jgi:FkbM family methyltransferase
LSLAGFLHRRISPFGVAGRALRIPLRLIPDGAVVPVLGGVNRGYRWIAGASTAGCWFGSFEEDHQSALRRLVAPGMVAYDIGANVGFYTLALARLLTPSGHVYAFEPDARNAHLLRRHLKINAVDNVTVVQTAVSSGGGLVAFEGERDQARMASEGRYLVPSISLDEFIARGNPFPSFIKMDVEGAEAMVLEGATSILSRAATSWMVAMHSDALRSRCRDVLSRSGCVLRGFDFAELSGEEFDFLALPRDLASR